MSPIDDRVRDSVSALFGGGASRVQFKRWKDNLNPGVASVLDGYAFGEIIWRKTLGRPNAARLSDGFTLEAWREDMVLVGDIDGGAYWDPLHVPYQPTLWDGKDDAEHWRVSFIVPGMKAGNSVDELTEHSTYTHIVPNFRRGVSWTSDGGRFPIVPVGLRAFDPPRVVFVKPRTSVNFSFEVVMTRAVLLP